MMHSAEILMIKEVVNDSSKSVGKYVRITGRLENFDPLRKFCVCSHDGSSILVDLELTNIANFPEFCLSQFMGEIRNDKIFPGYPVGSIYIKARISRNVEGLDLSLFERALLLRRQFIRDQLKDSIPTHPNA